MSLGKGLPNLGNTCYINSILQCLRYSKDFVYLLNKHDTNKNSLLVQSFVELLYAGAPTKCLYTLIKELAKTDEFKIMKQCDAHELFLYLIDKMFTEIKYIKNPFEGRLESTVTCQVCHNESITEYPYVSISVQMQANVQKVEALLDEFSKEEEIEDLIQCDKCEAKTKSHKRLKIIPNNIIVVHLKRFTGMSKNHSEIVIDEEITINETKYMLYSTCNHSGNLFGGHYTATCMKRDGTWTLCNDNHVESLASIPPKSDRPYLLFYSKN